MKNFEPVFYPQFVCGVYDLAANSFVGRPAFVFEHELPSQRAVFGRQCMDVNHPFSQSPQDFVFLESTEPFLLSDWGKIDHDAGVHFVTSVLGSSFLINVEEV